MAITAVTEAECKPTPVLAFERCPACGRWFENPGQARLVCAVCEAEAADWRDSQNEYLSVGHPF